MSTHSAEFGSGPLSPEDIARAAEERELDRMTNSGDHYRPPAESTPVSNSDIPITQRKTRARRRRPSLPDFTGIGSRDEGVYVPEEPVPEDPEAVAEERRTRIKQLIEQTRQQLEASSGENPRVGFIFVPRPTPDQLAEQGPVTSYKDAHGYDVVTLRDSRDPNQRYDPKK